MPFQISLTEHRDDGTVLPLLVGEISIDMPSLLFAYELQLLVEGGCVDCSRFTWSGDPAADLVHVFAQLKWSPFTPVAPGAVLRFRIEQEGDFLLETQPVRDPRAFLADVLAGSSMSDQSESELLAALLWDAPVVEACRYAASIGWGIHSGDRQPRPPRIAQTSSLGLAVS
jgi:hypothetical protein